MSYRVDVPHDRSIGIVLRWCEWYARGLPPDVVEDRLDELASDLHEHESDLRCTGVEPRLWRRHILGRAIRGVPSDLLWRETQLRRREAMRLGMAATREVILTSRVVTAVLVVGGTAVALGALAGAHAVAVGGGSAGAGSAALIALATTALALCLLLFARPTTRIVGALGAGIALVVLGVLVSGAWYWLVALLVPAAGIIASGVLLARLRRR